MKEFSLEENKYDQSTYGGRFRGFLEIIDPRCLFISDEKLSRSQRLLTDFATYGVREKFPYQVTNEELWEAKKVKEAVIHPITGEKINPLFRMAAFVPVNVPLVAGMLSFTSPFGTVFMQWANQSYNSAINYANRSGSDVKVSDIAKSYSIAVSLSCSIALAARYVGNNGPKVIRRLARIPFVVPFIAVSSAGSANLYFSRYKEIENGVPVVDANGNEKGVSKVAAKIGIFQTMLSRSILLVVPVLVLPTALMSMVPKSQRKFPKRMFVFDVLSVVVGLCVGLPSAIALFPQKLELNCSKLEEEFRNLEDENGQKIEKLYSNKGL
eukprot:snap_masked-scaffold_16-processed-gene-4.20-mRNA-1 protein AED:0.02 eAED:0.02 QI:0/-1/0/1/-1/1/1/0/324